MAALVRDSAADVISLQRSVGAKHPGSSDYDQQSSVSDVSDKSLDKKRAKEKVSRKWPNAVHEHIHVYLSAPSVRPDQLLGKQCGNCPSAYCSTDAALYRRSVLPASSRKK